MVNKGLCPVYWAFVEKLVLQDVSTNFIVGERTASQGRRQEKRCHLEATVQGTLQVGSLLESNVAVLDEHLSVSQDFLGKKLLASPHIHDVGSPFFFHRRKGFASAVGQAISMMHNIQIQCTMVRDADLRDILDQLPGYRTIAAVAQSRTRTRTRHHNVVSSQVTGDLQSSTHEPRIDAVNDHASRRYTSRQYLSSLLNVPFAYRRLAPVKKENILWAKNKKMSIDIFLYKTYFN